MKGDLKEKIQCLEKKLAGLKKDFGWENKRKEVKGLEDEMRSPDFWQKKERASEAGRKAARLKKEIEPLEELEKEIKELKSLADLAEKEEESGEISREIAKLEKKIAEKSKEIFLGGRYDKNSAILTRSEEHTSELQSH